MPEIPELIKSVYEVLKWADEQLVNCGVHETVIKND